MVFNAFMTFRYTRVINTTKKALRKSGILYSSQDLNMCERGVREAWLSICVYGMEQGSTGKKPTMISNIEVIISVSKCVRAQNYGALHSQNLVYLRIALAI